MAVSQILREWSEFIFHWGAWLMLRYCGFVIRCLNWKIRKPWDILNKNVIRYLAYLMMRYLALYLMMWYFASYLMMWCLASYLMVWYLASYFMMWYLASYLTMWYLAYISWCDICHHISWCDIGHCISCSSSAWIWDQQYYDTWKYTKGSLPARQKKVQSKYDQSQK